MSKKSVMKDSKEKPQLDTITKKQATRGKHVSLHKYWKGVAGNFLNKADRRHYLNLMLDAVSSEHEWKTAKRKSKDQLNAD